MRRILPLVVLLSVAFAPAPFPKQTTSKSDLRRLQGAWSSNGGSEVRAKLAIPTKAISLVSFFVRTPDPGSTPPNCMSGSPSASLFPDQSELAPGTKSAKDNPSDAQTFGAIIRSNGMVPLARSLSASSLA